MSKSFKVAPGAKVRLKNFSTSEHEGVGKRAGLEAAAEHVAALDLLMYRLYAENKRSLLIVLQGMDAAGKDGVIRRMY